MHYNSKCIYSNSKWVTKYFKEPNKRKKIVTINDNQNEILISFEEDNDEKEADIHENNIMTFADKVDYKAMVLKILNNKTYTADKSRPRNQPKQQPKSKKLKRSIIHT
jgi:hypothetical protein